MSVLHKRTQESLSYARNAPCVWLGFEGLEQRRLLAIIAEWGDCQAETFPEIHSNCVAVYDDNPTAVVDDDIRIGMQEDPVGQPAGKYVLVEVRNTSGTYVEVDINPVGGGAKIFVLTSAVDHMLVMPHEGDDKVDTQEVNAANGYDFVATWDEHTDSAVTVFGGDGKDKIWGSEFGDCIKGGRGDNEDPPTIMEPNRSDDTIYGGPGGDFLEGKAGHNLIFGDAGADTIFGGGMGVAVDNGDDTIYGGDGMVEITMDTVIDTGNSFPDDAVIVREGNDGPTTLTLVDGGLLGGGLTLSETSRFEMTGGTITTARRRYGLLVTDNSTAALSEGLITGSVLRVQHASAAITGSVVIESQVSVGNDGHASISGGKILGGAVVFGNATLEITDGEFSGLFGELLFEGDSEVHIFGGDLSSPYPIPLRLENAATLNVHGFNLAIEDGRLTGMLADGRAINSPIDVNDDARVILIQVPEPNEFMLISCALVWFVSSVRIRQGFFY